MTRFPDIFFEPDDTALRDDLFISSGTLEVFHHKASREIRSVCGAVCLSGAEDGAGLYLEDILHKEVAPV